MKLIYIIAVISVALNLFFAFALVKLDTKQFQLQNAYDASMSYIESQMRTHSGARNPAYICKTK